MRFDVSNVAQDFESPYAVDGPGGAGDGNDQAFHVKFIRLEQVMTEAAARTDCTRMAAASARKVLVDIEMCATLLVWHNVPVLKLEAWDNG